MAEYYDHVLVAIPAVLAAITGALLLAGAPPAVALPVGALAATPVVGHAMFVRSPARERTRDDTARSDARPAD